MLSYREDRFRTKHEKDPDWMALNTEHFYLTR